MLQHDDRDAYVQLRSKDLGLAARVRGQRAEMETQLARLDAALAGLQPAEIQRQQGILFAYARIRRDAHAELAELAAQPWFAGLAYEAAGDAPLRLLFGPASPHADAFILSVRLAGGVLLRLRLRPDGRPGVEILAPRPTSRATALDEAALGLLAAGGRLVEVVILCAQRLGLQLDQAPHPAPRPIYPEVDRHYFCKRAAWLTAYQPAPDHRVADVAALLAEVAEAERKLFILDELNLDLTRQGEDPERVRAYQREWEVLCRLPNVASLSVHGDRLELRTGAISIQGIHVGSFCVTCDFSAPQLEIVNLTKAIEYDEETRYDHPHVRSGRPCLGNVSGAVASYLATRDAPKLIDVTLDFLQSYNPASPHRSLEAWA